MAYEILKEYIRDTYPHLVSLLTEKQYEQIDWIDATDQTNERVPIVANEPKIELQQQRIFSRLHFLFLLRQGGESGYKRFINGQKEPRLTIEHFSVLSHSIKNLSEAEYQQLWVATLTSKSCKAYDLAATEMKEKPPFDSVDFLAKVMTKAPQVYPAAAELLEKDDTAKKGLTTMFDTGHFRHMMYVEGGFNMFSKLLEKIQKGEVTQKELDLWFAYWLIDITGFRAQTKELGSVYLNDNTYKAVVTLKRHINELLRNPHYPNYPILYNYLADRARWLGLEESATGSNPSSEKTFEISNLILARFAAMLRLFTPEEKEGLLRGLSRLKDKLGDEKYKNVITILDPFQKTDEPTPTYGPALLANLRSESNYEDAIVIGLPIYAYALELYRKLRTDNEIDKSVPLSLNGLAEKDSIQALIKGGHFVVSIDPENGKTLLKSKKLKNTVAFFVSSLGDTTPKNPDSPGTELKM